MKDDRCVDFLQWALPQLHLRWSGFRKVRKQVCKRLDRRIRQLGLSDIEEYRAWLDAHADEWICLDSLCRITISRFNRDQAVFRDLTRDVLPTLATAVIARGDGILCVWSAGCASGEEPYTLAVLWHLELEPAFPELGIDVVATDVDAGMLQRARDARYEYGSLKELPAEIRARAFAAADGSYRLKKEYKRHVRFIEQDIRREQPDGLFDLILCRNLAFTYFDAELQMRLAEVMIARLHAGGALVIGAHEHLPDGVAGLVPWLENSRIYRKNVGGG